MKAGYESECIYQRSPSEPELKHYWNGLRIRVPDRVVIERRPDQVLDVRS